MENRSENRSTNCKNQTQDRTSNQSTNRNTNSSQNSATNEHKHPNQYTKGADDESAKNSVNSRSAQKTAADACPAAPDRTTGVNAEPARLPALFSSAESSGLSRFYFSLGSNCCHSVSNSSCTRPS